MNAFKRVKLKNLISAMKKGRENILENKSVD